jgi:hypothetical protein
VAVGSVSDTEPVTALMWQPLAESCGKFPGQAKLDSRGWRDWTAVSYVDVYNE